MERAKELGVLPPEVSMKQRPLSENRDHLKTEDEMQREELGPRGVPGEPDPARMTPQQKKNTPKDIDDGHTA
jgi:hypothetical protein